MNTTRSEGEILSTLTSLEGDGPIRMKCALRAKRELIAFKRSFLRVAEAMEWNSNNPDFNRYSLAAYQWSSETFKPLHDTARRIGALVTNQEGMQALEGVGLVKDEHFPRYKIHRTDCFRFWDQLKDVVDMLEPMVNQRASEEEQLLSNLCSLKVDKVSKEDAAGVCLCTVCMENYVEGESVVSLSCSHKYHVQCALSWLVINPKCPIDRINVFSTAESA